MKAGSVVSPDFDTLFAQMFKPRTIPRSPAPEPAWDRMGRLATPAGELAYFVAGSGPTVLLVHGWEGIHGDLDAFVAPLVARGRRVVAFDHFAHGASVGETATLFDFRDAVRFLGDEFGSFDAIVAHSVGGPATALALQDRTRAKRAALIASPTRYEDFVRLFASIVGVPDEVLLAELRARHFDIDALDLPKIAATLDIPALLVHSADDRVTSPAGSERIAAAWRGSRLMRVDGLGHNRILRDPSVVEAVVAYVAPIT